VAQGAGRRRLAECWSARPPSGDCRHSGTRAEGSAHPYAHRATKYAQHREFPRVCRLFVLSRVRQCSGTV